MQRVSRWLGVAVFVSVMMPAFVQAQPPGKRPIDRAKTLQGPVDQTTDKIVGGKPAKAGEYPFQVALIASNTPAGREHLGQFCGAALIDTNWVLTAAHCVPHTGPEELDVYVGSIVLPSGPGGAAAEGGATRLHVSRVISHQEYDRDTHDNDIALLKLASPAPATLKPAMVASGAQHTTLGAVGKRVVVIGWGATQEGGSTTPRLMKVDVSVQGQELCQANYQEAEAGTQLTRNMFCAGEPEGGKDSCQGDSGGFIGAPDQSGHVQLGIVSWGFGCARPKLFGVYTRVANYKEWISQIMQTF